MNAAAAGAGSASTPVGPPCWADAVQAMLKAANIRQVGMVPAAGRSRLIKLCEADKSMRIVRLTTEEEGVALAAGARLGGEKGVLLSQKVPGAKDFRTLTKGA
ncbi:MAG: thiamine pyrophosphate-binding protein [Burkholderiales bacterium]